MKTVNKGFEVLKLGSVLYKDTGMFIYFNFLTF